MDTASIPIFVPESFFYNPISTNEAICNKSSIKINLLLMALKRKDPLAVTSLVAQLEDDIDAIGYRACIIKAFEIGDFHLLSSLLNNRIFKRLEKELQPLHLFCNAPRDYALLVEQFCDGLDFNLQDDNGDTPIHFAVRKKHKHTVGKINHRVDLNLKNKQNLKPIEVAAMAADFNTIKLLNEAGADINSCIDIVKSAIKAAGESGNISEKNEKTLLLSRILGLMILTNPKEAARHLQEVEKDPQLKLSDDASTHEYLYACFKGGGIKGLAYLFAIIEAIKQNLINLDSFKGFAGTSAGSITAALLALRLPLDRLEEIMRSKNFMEFFDYYDEALVHTILEKLKEGVGIWTIIRNYWLLQGTKTLLDTNLGFCKGDNFLQWIRGLIGEAIANTPIKHKLPENITFRDLHDNPEFFKELVVYGSNVNTGMAERYSYETTPDMCIADAIRISMSIPIVFAPHKKYIFKDGVR